MVSGEILFRIRNTPPKRWRAEGYLVKFSPCGLGAELIMQNSTDRNHWGGTIGRWSWSSWSWTWSWPWLYWSPCWWLWGDYAEQQWPQPFGRRGNNRSISDPHFIKPVQAENVLEQRKYLYLQSGHFALINWRTFHSEKKSTIIISETIVRETVNKSYYVRACDQSFVMFHIVQFSEKIGWGVWAQTCYLKCTWLACLFAKQVVTGWYSQVFFFFLPRDN